MAKLRYHFNPHTLTFDVVSIPLYKRLAKILIHTIFYVAIFLALGYTSSLFLDNPVVQGLKRENAEYVLNYELAIRRMESLSQAITELEKRDNEIYRAIFESDPIPNSIRKGGYGGARRYADFLGFENSDVLISAMSKLDELTWRTYVQSRSFDEVTVLAKNKEKLLRCIPAIQPLSVKDLVRISDFYGMRIHPITHKPTMHTGIDFAGSIGTPIYSTGDGVVIEASYSFHGYGKQVIIDHGFGYKTRYAHLNKISVRVGQHVKRAEQIGELGNTGRSTGPHLHYEVILRNKPVNPINYFSNMTEEDYENMLENYSSQFLD